METRTKETRCAPSIRKLAAGHWQVSKGQLKACFGDDALQNQKIVMGLVKFQADHPTLSFNDAFTVIKYYADGRVAKKDGFYRQGLPGDRPWVPTDVSSAMQRVKDAAGDISHLMVSLVAFSIVVLHEHH